MSLAEVVGMADTYDLELVQNETFERTFRWLEDDVAQTFAGWTLHSQVRAKEDKNSAMLLDLADYMTVESSGLEDAPDDDRVRLRIPGDVLADQAYSPYKRGNAAWDLFIVLDGDPTTSELIVEGKALMNPAATDIEVAP